ncbi:MAG: hypothetical protein HQ534_00715 [Armatimonadetes bacterium]|nr:hypothetical protein [Armatimonadota bacterium]
MLKNILLSGLILFFIWACAGEDSLGTDTTPPDNPNLVEHLGDTGDIFGIDTLNFYNIYGNEMNGIDALPEGDWIRIQWEHPLDNDLDFAQIFRFSLQENIVTKIDSISFPHQDEYIDKYGSLIGKDWFYFIKIFDTSGNFAISDSVCYNLLNKPVLIEPPDNNEPMPLDSLHFKWWDDQNVLTFRLLLFDSNYDIIWQYEPTGQPNAGSAYEIEYDGPSIQPQQILWRVDAFGYTMTHEVEDKWHTVFSGSESEERRLNFR